MRSCIVHCVVVSLLVMGFAAATATLGAETAGAANWHRGPGNDPAFFPIAVWLQDPKNAGRYRELGINTYVAVWRGPTDEQIELLKKHGMKLVCSQDEQGLKFIDEQLIIAWMHGDEPDNAQSLGRGQGYGPPVLPEKIVEDYRAIRAKDASRPVLLNLGQGVAWDGWHGRGVRTNHPEDYEKYLEGCDLASFDIYPAVHDRPAVAGKLWYVPYGVTRLTQWVKGKKPVWNCIECTRISNVKTKPTPAQVQAEVWMSIIHGSRGLIYFCHQFEPNFIEAGLLADQEMAQAVKAINQRVLALAPVIHSPAGTARVELRCEPARVSDELAKTLGGQPVAMMARQHDGKWYLLTVAMDGRPVRATFVVPGLKGQQRIEVLDEGREIIGADGCFSDDYAPYAAHLYRIAIP